MANDYAALQARIAAELRRADLTSQIVSEIASAIEFYQYEEFPWTEASMVPFQTVQGQRYYALPANFLRVTDVLSQIGNYTYYLQPETEQYIDRIDWGNTFWTSYPLLFSIWTNQIRLFPPPQANLPVQVKGIIQQLPLQIPTKTWAATTVFSLGDTVADIYGNVQQCTTGGHLVRVAHLAHHGIPEHHHRLRHDSSRGGNHDPRWLDAGMDARGNHHQCLDDPGGGVDPHAGIEESLRPLHP